MSDIDAECDIECQTWQATMTIVALDNLAHDHEFFPTEDDVNNAVLFLADLYLRVKGYTDSEVYEFLLACEKVTIAENPEDESIVVSIYNDIKNVWLTLTLEHDRVIEALERIMLALVDG